MMVTINFCYYSNPKSILDCTYRKAAQLSTDLANLRGEIEDLHEQLAAKQDLLDERRARRRPNRIHVEELQSEVDELTNDIEQKVKYATWKDF